MTEDTFAGRKRQYPDLGFVTLYGRRTELWNDSDLGIAVIGDRVVIEKANVLEQMGLFLINIEITDLSPQDILICQMALPKCGLNLSSNKIDVIEDECGKDSEERYFGSSDSWKIKGHDGNLPFFAPADSKFLSQLQFSFHTELPPTQSSAQVEH